MIVYIYLVYILNIDATVYRCVPGCTLCVDKRQQQAPVYTHGSSSVRSSLPVASKTPRHRIAHRTTSACIHAKRKPSHLRTGNWGTEHPSPCTYFTSTRTQRNVCRDAPGAFRPPEYSPKQQQNLAYVRSVHNNLQYVDSQCVVNHREPSLALRRAEAYYPFTRHLLSAQQQSEPCYMLLARLVRTPQTRLLLLLLYTELYYCCCDKNVPAPIHEEKKKKKTAARSRLLLYY